VCSSTLALHSTLWSLWLSTYIYIFEIKRKYIKATFMYLKINKSLMLFYMI
jgi:hypothetical protein